MENEVTGGLEIFAAFTEYLSIYQQVAKTKLEGRKIPKKLMNDMRRAQIAYAKLCIKHGIIIKGKKRALKKLTRDEKAQLDDLIAGRPPKPRPAKKAVPKPRKPRGFDILSKIGIRF